MIRVCIYFVWFGGPRAIHFFNEMSKMYHVYPLKVIFYAFFLRYQSDFLMKLFSDEKLPFLKIDTDRSALSVEMVVQNVTVVLYIPVQHPLLDKGKTCTCTRETRHGPQPATNHSLHAKILSENGPSHL